MRGGLSTPHTTEAPESRAQCDAWRTCFTLTVWTLQSSVWCKECAPAMRAQLARAITAVENRRPESVQILKSLFPAFGPGAHHRHYRRTGRGQEHAGRPARTRLPQAADRPSASSPSIPPAPSAAAPSSATASACRRTTPTPASSSAAWPRAARSAAWPRTTADVATVLDASRPRPRADRNRRRRPGRGRHRAPRRHHRRHAGARAWATMCRPSRPASWRLPTSS